MELSRFNKPEVSKAVTRAARVATATLVVGAGLIAGRAGAVRAQGGQELQFCRNTYPNEMYPVNVVAAGNWRGDNLAQFAVGSYPDGQVDIFQQNPTHKLTREERIDVGSQVTDLKSGDIRGNGREGLLIISNDYVKLRLRDENGQLQTISYKAPWPSGMQAGTLANVDSDPENEVLVADFWAGGPFVLDLKGDRLEMLTNSPLEKVNSRIAETLRKGPFVLTKSGEVVKLTDDSRFEMREIWEFDSGEFNGKGGEDIAGIDGYDNILYLWMSPCYDLVSIPGMPDNTPMGLSIGDLNEDGIDDLAVAGGGLNRFAVVWGGDLAVSQFELEETPLGYFNFTGTAIANFGNGRPELLLGNRRPSSDDVFVTFNGNRQIEKVVRRRGAGVNSNIAARDVTGDYNTDYGYVDYGHDLTIFENGCRFNSVPSPTPTPLRPTAVFSTCPLVPTATNTPEPIPTPKPRWEKYIPAAFRDHKSRS